jgi:hypothetical protein
VKSYPVSWYEQKQRSQSCWKRIERIEVMAGNTSHYISFFFFSDLKRGRFRSGTEKKSYQIVGKFV